MYLTLEIYNHVIVINRSGLFTFLIFDSCKYLCELSKNVKEYASFERFPMSRMRKDKMY